MVIDFLERERDRQTDRKTYISVKEKHQSIASHMCPNRGSDLQPRYVP